MVAEVDAMPGGYVCSASFKDALGPGDAVRQVAAGDRAIRKLYSKQQRAFYAAHAALSVLPRKILRRQSRIHPDKGPFEGFGSGFGSGDRSRGARRGKAQRDLAAQVGCRRGD